MRVEIKIDPNNDEPYAFLCISKMTPAIQEAIYLLENEETSFMFSAKRAEKIYMIDPEFVELIHTEGREVVLYDKDKVRYVINKPLYEIEKNLSSHFFRISKSAIINIQCIDHVEASFNGTMEVIMKSGLKELITRSYRQKFKERIGV